MKSYFHFSARRRIAAVLLIAMMLSLVLTACGTHMKGAYVPEDPNASGVLFTKMTFSGSTVRIEAAGSSMALDYKIKNGEFSFKDDFNFKISGETVPKTMIFSALSDGTFWLDGIHYIPAD